MSIASDMQLYKLYRNKKVETTTGTDYEHVYIKDINVSIYKSSNTVVTNNVKYNDSTHVGISFDKGIKEGDIILSNDIKYIVITSQENRRQTSLLLKEVNTSV